MLQLLLLLLLLLLCTVLFSCNFAVHCVGILGIVTRHLLSEVWGCKAAAH